MILWNVFFWIIEVDSISSGYNIDANLQRIERKDMRWIMYDILKDLKSLEKSFWDTVYPSGLFLWRLQMEPDFNGSNLKRLFLVILPFQSWNCLALFISFKNSTNFQMCKPKPNKKCLISGENLIIYSAKK